MMNTEKLRKLYILIDFLKQAISKSIKNPEDIDFMASNRDLYDALANAFIYINESFLDKQNQTKKQINEYNNLIDSIENIDDIIEIVKYKSDLEKKWIDIEKEVNIYLWFISAQLINRFKSDLLNKKYVIDINGTDYFIHIISDIEFYYLNKIPIISNEIFIDYIFKFLDRAYSIINLFQSIN